MLNQNSSVKVAWVFAIIICSADVDEAGNILLELLTKKKLYSEAIDSVTAFLEISCSDSESARFGSTTIIKLSLGSCFFQVTLVVKSTTQEW